MDKIFVFLGSVNAFLAVALGAFGAHGLKSRLSPEMFEIFEIGVKYHIAHALGLILIGILAHLMARTELVYLSGWLILAGIVIFSGSLYVLSISGVRWWGAVTPLGGLSFLAGWVLLAIAALRGF